MTVIFDSSLKMTKIVCFVLAALVSFMGEFCASSGTHFGEGMSSEIGFPNVSIASKRAFGGENGGFFPITGDDDTPIHSYHDVWGYWNNFSGLSPQNVSKEEAVPKEFVVTPTTLAQSESEGNRNEGVARFGAIGNSSFGSENEEDKSSAESDRKLAIIRPHFKSHYWAGLLAKSLGPFLSVLSLWSEKCWTVGYDQGTCFSRKECILRGGRPFGVCAAGFGVCCVFSYSCDSFSALNRTYFVNPEYPSAVGQTATNCAHTIGKLDGICQLRLDFEEFYLQRPEKDGVCRFDSFFIYGVEVELPPLCGDLTGHHMYLPVGFDPVVKYIVSLGSDTPWRRWKIRTAKIKCNSQPIAPGGCLQFHQGAFGRLTSFNYVDDFDSNIVGLNYGICVRRERGFCAIRWTKCHSAPPFHRRRREVRILDPRNGTRVENATRVKLAYKKVGVLTQPPPVRSTEVRIKSKLEETGSEDKSVQIKVVSSSSPRPSTSTHKRPALKRTKVAIVKPKLSYHTSKSPSTALGTPFNIGGLKLKSPATLISPKNKVIKLKGGGIKGSGIKSSGGLQKPVKIKLTPSKGLSKGKVKGGKLKAPLKVKHPKFKTKGKKTIKRKNKKRKGGCGKVIPFPFPAAFPIPILGGGGGGGGGGGKGGDKHSGWSSGVISSVEPYLIRVVTNEHDHDDLGSICLEWEQIPCDVWHSKK